MNDLVEIPSEWLKPKFVKQIHELHQRTHERDKLFARLVGAKDVTLSSGVDKLVYIPDSFAWVVKVAHKPEISHELDNKIRQEIETINLLKSKYPEFAHHLPDAIYLGKCVGVMRKYMTDHNNFVKQATEIKRIGMKMNVIQDVNSKNIGWLGEHFYFIDLGHDLLKP
jgi:hypothetical protein